MQASWERPKSSRGFTLLEIMIVSVIFSLLVATAIQVSVFATRATSAKLTETNVQVKGERTLKLLIEELAISHNLSVEESTGDNLSYYSPLDIDQDGTPLNKVTRLMDYGADSGTVSGAGEMYFSFKKDRTLREAEEGVDLNLDGDKTDEFDIGYIEQFIDLAGTANDVTRVIGVNNIIQRKDQWGRSIFYDSGPQADNDPTGRIFSQNDASLRINLWIVGISEGRSAHLVHCQGEVFLRNQSN